MGSRGEAARPLFYALGIVIASPVMRISALFIALLALAGCQRSSDVPTAEENRQLDDAANLLDQAPANLEHVDDRALASDNEVESNTF
ncbi:MAG: hypothetical protein HOP96_01835 [Sphingomonas sp.]|nr:hypothetical protein [Sphingomonas sp.]